MMHIRSLFTALFAAILLAAPIPVSAGDTTGLSRVELRPGWRLSDGSHVAAFQIVLEPGWKTYWRAPGDVGIPPQFDWSGSKNIASLDPSWPTPHVFFEQGMRSVGYKTEVVIPLRMTATDPANAIHLAGKMQIGICKDICIPASFSFRADLPRALTRPDPLIAAALTNRPFSAREAGVRRISCEVEPGQDGGLVLHSRIDMPALGGTEHVVVEAGNPHIWVAEPDSRREGDSLIATTRLVHVESRSFVLDRSALRFTVIGASHAVDIQGCTP
jgi:DsbC/DsbD-like thiol-disulfide interchange protein